MAATTPDEIVRTLTVPFALNREQARVTHYHEAKPKDATHLGAILVLANSVIDELGDDVSNLVVTVEVKPKARAKAQPKK